MRNQLWWIEKPNKHLLEFGRIVKFKSYTKIILDCGAPRLFETRSEARINCRAGEKPVKVKIVKI